MVNSVEMECGGMVNSVEIEWGSIDLQLPDGESCSTLSLESRPVVVSINAEEI